MITRHVGDVELAAVDFEFTGLDPRHGHRVVEVAVVRGARGGTPSSWSTLVDPCRSVEAGEIHGITDAMVRGAPRFAAVAPELLERLDGAVLVAHNARWDLAFLGAELTLAAVEIPPLVVLDTLGLSRRVLPGLASHSLSSVCAHLGIPRDGAHRAEHDARAAWTVAWTLLERADPTGQLTLGDALALARRKDPAKARAVALALRAAAERGEPVTIDYCGHARPDGLFTRRSIVVRRVSHARVHAFCQLRGEDRVFRLDRIRLVE